MSERRLDHDRGLVERVHELAALDAALLDARTGTGATVLVEGPPGIGKTGLLRAAIARAGSRGGLSS